MKPGFVHSYFLLIYLRLSKPMYFPSRYHRKDKSKNLVYFSQTIVRKKFYKLSFIYRYVYFFFPDFVRESTNEFFRSTVSHASSPQLAQFFFIFFFNLRFIFFFIPFPSFLFSFRFCFKIV